MKTELSALIGKTLTGISINEVDGDYGFSHEVIFRVSDSEKYKLFHKEDCSEIVYIADICGNIMDLLGSPIVESEETEEWGFYRFRTKEGCVVFRFCETGSEYYCVTIDFVKLELE